ncbi:hypothetical protein, partial [Endozoicomonas sp. YOMI1]|uniref:hypothetical protein n=1 Tax=Endozoicomonas sp. YOMI1 TaxID=2828739 RepID=UPI0021493438
LSHVCGTPIHRLHGALISPPDWARVYDDFANLFKLTGVSCNTLSWAIQMISSVSTENDHSEEMAADAKQAKKLLPASTGSARSVCEQQAIRSSIMLQTLCIEQHQ